MYGHGVGYSGFDFTYLLYILPGMLLAMAAQWYVKATVNRYLEVPTSGRRTGAQIAQELLDAAGIQGVTIERHAGFLSDHYDPSARAVRLSPDIHDGTSVAAAGIAAHEVGHVLQHHVGYRLMTVRQKLVGPSRIGSQLSYVVIVAGIGIHFAGLAWLGVALFGAVLLFELVTVPVEINASMRAGETLRRMNLVTGDEAAGVRKVLTAAAFTYIAAMIGTLMQLLYFVSILRRGSDRR